MAFDISALPFAQLMGVEITAAEKDRVEGRLLVRDDLCTAGGILHGGAMMAFADSLGAVGAFLNITPGVRTTTLESKTNFIGAAPVGTKLVGEATPLHRGRTTQIWETRISTAEGKLIAKVTQTQIVL